MDQYKKLFHQLEEKVKGLGIAFNPPATKGALEELSKTINQKLPKDISDFYSLCNGFETEDNLFRIIPVEEILQYKGELEQSKFFFAEYLIYSDFWTIQVKSSEEYFILNGDHRHEDEMILTTSVYEFLNRYLRGDGIFGDTGLYHWIKEVKEKNNIT